jgi:hypothetical protein
MASTTSAAGGGPHHHQLVNGSKKVASEPLKSMDSGFGTEPSGVGGGSSAKSESGHHQQQQQQHPNAGPTRSQSMKVRNTPKDPFQIKSSKNCQLNKCIPLNNWEGNGRIHATFLYFFVFFFLILNLL